METTHLRLENAE